MSLLKNWVCPFDEAVREVSAQWPHSLCALLEWWLCELLLLHSVSTLQSAERESLLYEVTWIPFEERLHVEKKAPPLPSFPLSHLSLSFLANSVLLRPFIKPKQLPRCPGHFFSHLVFKCFPFSVLYPNVFSVMIGRGAEMQTKKNGIILFAYFHNVSSDTMDGSGRGISDVKFAGRICQKVVSLLI